MKLSRKKIFLPLKNDLSLRIACLSKNEFITNSSRIVYIKIVNNKIDLYEYTYEMYLRSLRACAYTESEESRLCESKKRTSKNIYKFLVFLPNACFDELKENVSHTDQRLIYRDLNLK